MWDFSHIYTPLLFWVKKDELLNYELAERIKQGEKTAFELVFKLYYKLLQNFACVYLRNTYLSAEIVQETFIKIWETRSSIDPGKSLKAYLYRCVHNNCINFCKKAEVNSRQTKEYLKELSYRLSLLELNPEDNDQSFFTNEQRIQAIQNTIDTLPLQCKEIFLLIRFENLTYNQVAEKLSISVNTVKTQLQRAMARLREEVI